MWLRLGRCTSASLAGALGAPLVLILLSPLVGCLPASSILASTGDQRAATSVSSGASVARVAQDETTTTTPREPLRDRPEAPPAGQPRDVRRGGRILDYSNSGASPADIPAVVAVKAAKTAPPAVASLQHPDERVSRDTQQPQQPQQQQQQQQIFNEQRREGARLASPVLQRLVAQSQASATPGGGGGNRWQNAPAPSQQQVSRADDEQEARASAQQALPGRLGEGTRETSSRSSSSPPSASSSSRRQGKSCAMTSSRNGRARGLRDVLNGARDLLTGGFSSIEQRAANFFSFGSNVIAALIPLASLLGLGGNSPAPSSPLKASSSSSSSDLNMPQELGSSAAANQTAPSTNNKRTGLLSPQGILVQIASRAGGLQTGVEHVMGWLERSMEHLPSFPRLHPQECVKRSICEAHADPSKHGALGLMLRLMFPATNLSITDAQDNMEYKVINKYRHAAGYGMARRLTDSTAASQQSNNISLSPGGSWTASEGQQAQAACKEKYEDCLVSLLDVAQNLLDFFLQKS